MAIALGIPGMQFRFQPSEFARDDGDRREINRIKFLSSSCPTFLLDDDIRTK